MSGNWLDMGRFCLGFLLIGGLFLWVQQLRVRERLPAILDQLFKDRLHYGLVGLIAGYSALPRMQALFSESALLGVFFFGGWFGLVVGMGVDRRNLRSSSGGLIFGGAVQAGMVGLGVGLAAYLANWLGEMRLQEGALLILCGICAAFVPIRQPVASLAKGMPPVWGGGAVPVTWVGLLLAGLGTMQLRGAPFEIRPPFAPPFKIIVVESLLGEVGWTLVLGMVTGLLLDLLIRGAERKELSLLMAGGLALGSGLAAVLGLEPLWVGWIGGAWLINATLHRLEVLQIVERSHSLMKIGLYFLAGWLLGHGLETKGLELPLFAWVLGTLAIIRSAAIWLGGKALQLAGKGKLKPISQKSRWGLTELEDWGLVVGVGLLELVPGSKGVTALAGIMAGQWILSLATNWFSLRNRMSSL